MRGGANITRHIRTQRQWEAQETRSFVYRTIRSICEMKAEHKVEPVVATERELKEHFEEKHFKCLECLVRAGVAIKTRGIKYDLYTLNYAAFEAYDQKMRELCSITA